MEKEKILMKEVGWVTGGQGHLLAIQAFTIRGQENEKVHSGIVSMGDHLYML